MFFPHRLGIHTIIKIMINHLFLLMRRKTVINKNLYLRIKQEVSTKEFPQQININKIKNQIIIDPKTVKYHR